jgi:hypothetical protein
MTYNGLAWPGLELSIRAVTAERNKVQRWIRSMDDAPKGYYKNPKRIRTKWEAMLADLDTGLKVLRDVRKAAEAPPKKRRGRRLNELDPGPARSDSDA